jgi:hypothetical protein
MFRDVRYLLFLVAISAFGQTSPLNVAQPLGGAERARWALNSSLGWQSLGVGALNSGFRTALNSPKEYHGTWEGFGKRLAMRTATVTATNTTEALLGAMWGEDPRYSPAPQGATFGSRVKRSIAMSVLAYDRNGNVRPAYARQIANVGINFASNQYRPVSQNQWNDALLRSVWGVTGRMAGNAFAEFWPDVRRIVFKK